MNLERYAKIMKAVRDLTAKKNFSEVIEEPLKELIATVGGHTPEELDDFKELVELFYLPFEICGLDFDFNTHHPEFQHMTVRVDTCEADGGAGKVETWDSICKRWDRMCQMTGIQRIKGDYQMLGAVVTAEQYDHLPKILLDQFCYDPSSKSSEVCDIGFRQGVLMGRMHRTYTHNLSFRQPLYTDAHGIFTGVGCITDVVKEDMRRIQGDPFNVARIFVASEQFDLSMSLDIDIVKKRDPNTNAR